MSESVPQNLSDLARELRLGELNARFGYRPGVLGSGLVAFFGVSAAEGLYHVVHEQDDSLLIMIPLTVLALVAWRISRMYTRFRGGVYLFEGGIAEAYGNRVKKVFTWDEITGIHRHRTFLLFYLIPLHDDEYRLTAQRRDVDAADGMLFNSRLLGARKAARMIADRIGQPWPR